MYSDSDIFRNRFGRWPALNWILEIFHNRFGGWLFLFVFFSLFFPVARGTSDKPELGFEIREIKGLTVEYSRRNRPGWNEARPGLILKGGDIIRTGTESQVELSLYNSGTVRLQQLSSLTVMDEGIKTANVPPKAKIEGIAWFSVDAPKGRFITVAGKGNISTSKGVFKIEKRADDLVAVACFEGHLLIGWGGDEITLPNGRQTIYSENHPPLEPRSSLVPTSTLLDWVLKKEIAITGFKKEEKAEEQKKKIQDIEIKQKLAEEPFLNQVVEPPLKDSDTTIKVTEIKVGGIYWDGFNDNFTLNRGNLEGDLIFIRGETRTQVYPVARVDISLDDGRIWQTAKGQKNFEFAFKPKDGANYKLRIRAVDKYENYSDINHRRCVFFYRHKKDEDIIRDNIKGLVDCLKEREYHQIGKYLHPEVKWNWDLGRRDMELNSPNLLIRYEIQRIIIKDDKARIELNWRKSPRNALAWTFGHTIFMLEKDMKNQWLIDSVLVDTGLF